MTDMATHAKIDHPRPRVVIVGAGFGGLAAARALSHAAADVLIVDRTNHHLFQPLLYQVATAALSATDVAVAVRTILRRQRNATMFLGEVVGIDPVGRYVSLEDGQRLPYDWLILATGAAYSFFGHPEWAPEAEVLKSLDDALHIRARLLDAFEQAERSDDADEVRRLLTFVVVGGGPTGVETAGALAEMARQTLRGEFRRINPATARVILCEAGPRLLSSFPEEQSAYAARALADLGVEVRTGAAVEAITDGTVSVAGDVLDASVVLWCAGVQARPAALWLNAAAARNGSIVVGPDCAVPGHPRVFAVGDVANYLDNGTALPALAPVAKQQGQWVGRHIAAKLGGRAPPRPFRYRDWGTMAVIGRSRAVALLGGRRFTGSLAWTLWSLVHLLLLVDFRSRLTVYVNWTWAWFTHGRGARLIVRETNQRERVSSRD